MSLSHSINTLRDFVVKRMQAFRADRRGSFAIITALSLPALMGGVGLGIEASYWLTTQRDMQNAADSAAIAAATNGSANYATEAKAVATLYGFTDGAGGVTVAVSNGAACPAGGNTCYSVTVTDAVPLYFAPLVGFTGNVVVNGKNESALVATSVANPASGTPTSYCILALATSGVEGIRTNGNPKANLAGCNTMSDTTSTCNGHNLNADIGNAHGTNDGCGVIENSGVTPVADPYSGLASNIPADTCGGTYAQEPAKKKDPALPASNLWSGTQSFAGNKIVCGDLQLSANTTISAPSNGVLVIENGQLDTNGYTLQTAAGTGLTVVFAGSNGAYTHAPTGGGILDIAAPTTGVWKGMAIYQAPTLTSGVDISAAGNSPAWDITGMVYLPHSSVTFSGAVNKASNGHSCFGMVVDNMTINGTGSILDHGECPAAGVTLPSSSNVRGKLVG